jgi:hypothetical protein
MLEDAVGVSGGSAIARLVTDNAAGLLAEGRGPTLQ